MAQEVVRLTSDFPPELIQQRTISLEKETLGRLQPPADGTGSCSGVALRALIQAGVAFPGCGRLNWAHSCHRNENLSSYLAGPVWTCLWPVFALHLG